MTQSNQVADSLRELGFVVEVVPIHTRGDVTQASLKTLGGVGVFAAALRLALLAGECDIAVHSFKDLPTAAVPGLMIGAVPRRADFADVIVCRDGLDLESLPTGATVGTGSARRAAAVLAKRPDLQIVDIRGNVGTRLGRVAGIDPDGPGDLDAVILARAGLERLGSEYANAPTLPALPAPAQGALAVEVRADDEEVQAAVAALDHPETRACALAERAVLAGLHAGCAAPVGAHASLNDGALALSAQVLSTDGQQRVELTKVVDFDWESERTQRDEAATQIGLDLATQLIDRGAGKITDLAATKPTRASHEAPGDARAGSGSGGKDDAPKGSGAAGDGNARMPAGSAPEGDRVSRWGSDDLPLGKTQQDRPLTGRTVLMPRPASDHLVEAVKNAGAHVIPQPLTSTVLTPSFDVKPNLKALGEGAYTWCVITSPRTLTALACHISGSKMFDEDVAMEPLADLLQAAKRAGTMFASLGETTTAALRDFGVKPDVSTGARATQEELLAAFSSGPSCQYYARAWFPGSSLSRPFLADAWAERGWEIDRTAVYKTVPVANVDKRVRTGWSHGMLDAAVFTAGSNARAAIELMGSPVESMQVVAFGEPSAQVAREVGLRVDAVAPTQDAAGIIAALVQVFEE